MSNQIILSDLTKYGIFCCYQLIKRYISNAEIGCDECFATFINEMETYRLIIPPLIYNTIEAYVDDHIAPIAFNPEETFDISNHEEILLEIVEKNPESSLANEEYRERCNIIMTLNEISDEFDEFAMEYLQPLFE